MPVIRSAAGTAPATSTAGTASNLAKATLLADPKGRHDAQHGVAEHKAMDDLVRELDDMDMSSSGWLTRFKTLRHKVEHHLEEEEEDVFPLARKLLSGSERDEMLEAFETRKAKAASG